MRFILGLLVGYCIRGKQRLLIATLTAIAVGCFIVLPAIALSLLALDVRRERLSRPPQTSVSAIIGFDYMTAQINVREANLNIRGLATGHTFTAHLTTLEGIREPLAHCSDLLCIIPL